jgi:hypothetical protein
LKRAFLALLLVACKPDFGGPLSLVTSTRILAVRGEPAEVNPGAAVTLTPLVVSPDGTQSPSLAFSLCLQPKPSSENDVANASCLAADGTQPAANGVSASVTVPSNACRLFGPDLPPTTAGQPQLQPRAPDATGGYFQPIRVDGAGPTTMALERIRCNLAAASADLAAAYAMQYTPNRNPQLAPLAATVNGQPVALDAIPAGATVSFTTGWTADSAEFFPVLDVLAQQLVTHREAMSVSWLATGGVFTDERTGRADTDAATDTANEWQAPAAGAVHLWLVLRDSRGGVDFASYELAVR